MRLTLLGAKDVKGFDIVKHGEKKTKFIEKEDQSSEEESEEEEDQEGQDEAEPDEQIEEQKL
jgi:hypothetical protein